MNLLVVSTWCPTPATNGSKLRAWHLIAELSTRHRVSVLTFAEPADDARGGELASRCARFEAVAASPFLSDAPGLRGLLSLTPRWLVQTRSPNLLSRARALAADCDVALALELPAAVHAADCGLPLVVDDVELGLLRDRLTRADGTLPLRQRLTWWKSGRFVQRLIAASAATTSVSELERDLLVDVGCDARKVGIVPNGVDAADLDIVEPIEPNTVIYPGAITYGANLEAVRFFLGDVWPRLRRVHPALTFRVTGETNPEGLASLGSHPGVVFTGRVPDVRPLIARSAVCVVPLRAGGGTRIKILQAMALGTPVVSTAKGAEGLAVIDGDTIEIADAPDRFAECVSRLLQDPGRRAVMVERARALIRTRYTWAASANALDAVLSHVQAQSRRR